MKDWIKHPIGLVVVVGILVLSAQVKGETSQLKTRIIPVASRYETGQPIMLQVELVNPGPGSVYYDPFVEEAEYDGRLLVEGPNSQPVPYIGPWSSAQTLGRGPSKTLAPGEALTVFTIDLASAYYIAIPGRYIVRSNGEFIPKSDPLQIDVQPGHLSVGDEIVGHLLKEFVEEEKGELAGGSSKMFLPWSIEKRNLDKYYTPELLRRPNGIVQVRLSKGAALMGAPFVFVWQVRQIVDTSLLQNQEATRLAPIEYLGQNRWGAVYVQDIPEHELWLDRPPKEKSGLLSGIKDRLRRALEISDASRGAKVR